MASFSSVLFPGAETPAGSDVTPDCFADLHLDTIVAAATAGTHNDDLAEFFNVSLHEITTVEYRQQVFRDLEHDDIRAVIQRFVDDVSAMRSQHDRATNLWHPLQRQGWFISAVESYCQAILLLRDGLATVEPNSQGLQDLFDYVAGYADSQTFRNLAADTAAVRAQLRDVRYTVHIHGLRVHVEKYENQTDYSLAVIDTFERFATQVRDDYHVPFKNHPDMNHVEEQILECVAKLYPEAFSLLAEFCDREAHFVEPRIGRFEREVRFYLAYLAFVDRVRGAGLPFTYPAVKAEPGLLDVENGFDLALAIKSSADDKPLVSNSFRLDGSERVLVVTGPNQGGKTTFARTIGQCAYLASLGCPIPAGRATLMLPDHIHTHFERQETLTTLHGKLDDELVRIHEILANATPASVIVMNESFSSTSVQDALLIGTKILHRIIELGCAAVYVTFLDELADLHPACVSMVGDVAPEDPTQRTFTFTRRPADGLAYAAALADKYALNYDALRKRVAR